MTLELDDKFIICDDLETESEGDYGSCCFLKNCECERGVCYKRLAYEELFQKAKNKDDDKVI